MSDSENKLPPPSQDPTMNAIKNWRDYWRKLGQPWRTEPEIDLERQEYLTQRRSVTLNIEQGIYAFKDIKLNRADVEWLLATHEEGQGPVDWSGGSQRGLTARTGLDLRGADLGFVNLSRLPLTKMRGGLSGEDWIKATPEQREMAAVHLEGVDLRAARLEDCTLSYAHLEGASLLEAHLEGADLYGTHLEGKYFPLKDQVQIRKQEIVETIKMRLPSADICAAFFDTETKLERIILSDQNHVGICVCDVHWGDANLTTVDWRSMKMLGDEYKAKHLNSQEGKTKTKGRQLREYQRAIQANRKLAVALQSQGLNEDAARFAYRAQKLQRVDLRLRRKFGQYLFFLILDLLAGYGYRPGRSVLWYFTVIVGFAIAYFSFGRLPLFPDTFVFSLTSFHGRGFFPGIRSETSLHDPLVVLAAIEAVIGLFIEISFIATFTQRYFGK